MTLVARQRAALMLVGGFRGWLTTEDANKWHEYIETVPLWQEYHKTVTRRDAVEMALQGAAATSSMLGSYETLATKVKELENELYAVGQAWYTANVAADVADECVVESVGDSLAELLSGTGWSPASQAAAQRARERAAARAEMHADEPPAGGPSTLAELEALAKL